MTTILCLALWGQAHAQRCLPGMKGLQVTAGAVDGFKLNRGNPQAFSLGAALATYKKNGNRWVFGGEYLQKEYHYGKMYIPVAQFTGEAGYYLKFLSDPTRTFSLSLGLSALAGYETVNRGRQLLPDGAALQNRERFLYGGAIALEAEVYLADRIVLLLGAGERYLPASSVESFHLRIYAGLKIIIN